MPIRLEIFQKGAEDASSKLYLYHGQSGIVNMPDWYGKITHSYTVRCLYDSSRGAEIQLLQSERGNQNKEVIAVPGGEATQRPIVDGRYFLVFHHTTENANAKKPDDR
jgi:hypothetical protein